MATTSYIDLDTRYKKRNKTYPLKLFIVHNRKSTSINTGYSVGESDWNSKQHKVKLSCKHYNNIHFLNTRLSNMLNNANTTINKLIESGEINAVQLPEIKERILNKLKDYDFISFTKELIEEFKNKKNYGNAKVYEETLTFVMKRFNEKPRIYFKQINKQWLQQTQDDHVQAGFGFGGLSIRFRTIRSIFNKAIDRQIITSNLYPFRDFKIKNSSRKRKIAIPPQAVKKFESYEAEKGSTKWHYKNYFLMMFYMRGANFYDIARLRVRNIDNEYIIFHRGKTHQEFIVKINEKIRNILNYYNVDNRKEDGYIFPILSGNNFTERDYQKIHEKLKYFNKGIRKIAEELKIDAHLTSYVARHTWATIADQKGADRRIIQKGLGHADMRTTAIYIDDIHVEKELDKLNDDILE